MAMRESLAQIPDRCFLADLALELTNVTKRFGSFTAVEDLSFALPRGRILG